MSTLKIPTAKVFEPLLAPARYKGAHGGRGSGKSHFFGELLVETCQAERGTLAVCIREAQRTLAQSSKRLIESKIRSLGLCHGFKLFNDKIETPGDGLVIFRGMQVRVLDYYESAGQVLAFHVNWLRSRGYKDAILHLPHDGAGATTLVQRGGDGKPAATRLGSITSARMTCVTSVSGLSMIGRAMPPTRSG